MTILKVEILLHYACSCNDFRDLDAPAIKEAIDEFCELGILYKVDKYQQRKIGCNQDALDAYVNEVLRVPLPKQVWVCK